MTRIFAIEGIDGCGKTTLIEQLGSIFSNVKSFREPGGCEESEKIREKITSNSKLSNDKKIQLFSLARTHLLKHIFSRHYLSENIIFFDRFILSNFAYQGQDETEMEKV